MHQYSQLLFTFLLFQQTLGKEFTVPAEFDWRNEGKVSAVRDQGPCNACYAFAVTSSIESALAIQYNLTFDGNATNRSTRVLKEIPPGNEHYLELNLSVQQLIDCTSIENNTSNANSTETTTGRPFINNGCQYGFIEETFRYVKESGLVPETLYPFTQNKSNCRQIPDVINNRAFIRDYAKKFNLSSEKLKELIYTTGPVISLINDSGDDFLYYTGGVMENSSETDSYSSEKPNHAVLIVGWGQTKGGEHFIIKNSWSLWWGESGYGRIAFGHRSLGKYVYYPLLSGQVNLVDRYRSILFWVFLAVCISTMLSFYTVVAFCSSDFYQKKIRQKYFKVTYTP